MNQPDAAVGRSLRTWPGRIPIRNHHRRVLEAGLCYFMTIVTLGWLIGPVRDYFVRAGGDALLGILSQTVVTLLVLIWAAGWVIEAFGVPARASAGLAVGAGAVGLALASDLLAGFLLYGLTPLQVVGEFTQPEGVVVAISLALAAMLPLFRARRES